MSTSVFGNTSVGIALQPIVDLQCCNQHAHYEALLRISGSTRFGSSHVELIGAAEREGWIDEVDLIVLCDAVSLLRAERTATIAVNVSPCTLELAASRVLRFLSTALDVTERLILEITETAPISDLCEVKSFFLAAKDRGCLLALDDFGSDVGYISRELVSVLKPNYLKLDRSVIEHTHGKNIVLPLALDLAHHIDAKIVAEFIDSAEKVEFVRSCGIRYAQGAFFGMPRPSSDVFPARVFEGDEQLA